MSLPEQTAFANVYDGSLHVSNRISLCVESDVRQALFCIVRMRGYICLIEEFS